MRSGERNGRRLMEGGDGQRKLGVELQNWGVSGGSVAVVSGDESWTLASGTRGSNGQSTSSMSGAEARSSSDQRFTAETLFPLGSLQKALIAVQAARLARTGVIGWEKQYLEEFLPPASGSVSGFDLVGLLSHSSGLPSYDFLLHGSVDRALSAVVRRRVRHLNVRPHASGEYMYSNLAYVILCYLLEHGSGVSWRTLFSEFVGAILGHNSFHFGGIPAAINVAASDSQRDVFGAFLDPMPHLLINISGIWLSAADLVEVMRLHLFGTSGSSFRIDDADKRFLQRPRVSVPTISSNHPQPIAGVGYGCGWLVGLYRGFQVLIHSSSVASLKGLTVLVPERGLGVTICCTSNVRHTIDEAGCCVRCSVAFPIMDVFLGLRPELPITTRRPTPQARKISSGFGEQLTISMRRQLLGRYFHPAFGEVAIEGHPEGLTTFRYGSVIGRVSQARRRCFLQSPETVGLIPLESSGSRSILLRIEPSVSAFEFALC